jgi:hypothetical protein
MMNRPIPFVASLLLIALFAVPALANAVHEGKVVSVDDGDNKIIVLIKGSDEREFKIDEKCEVTLDGKKAELDQIEEGASVKLMTKKVKGQEVVVKIEAKSAE